MGKILALVPLLGLLVAVLAQGTPESLTPGLGAKTPTAPGAPVCTLFLSTLEI